MPSSRETERYGGGGEACDLRLDRSGWWGEDGEGDWRVMGGIGTERGIAERTVSERTGRPGRDTGAPGRLNCSSQHLPLSPPLPLSFLSLLPALLFSPRRLLLLSVSSPRLLFLLSVLRRSTASSQRRERARCGRASARVPSSSARSSASRSWSRRPSHAGSRKPEVTWPRKQCARDQSSWALCVSAAALPLARSRSRSLLRRLAALLWRAQRRGGAGGTGAGAGRRSIRYGGGRRGGDECMREEVSGDRRREHVKVLGVPLSNDPSIPAGEEEAVRARAAQEQRGGGELRLNAVNQREVLSLGLLSDTVPGPGFRASLSTRPLCAVVLTEEQRAVRSRSLLLASLPRPTLLVARPPGQLRGRKQRVVAVAVALGSVFSALREREPRQCFPRARVRRVELHCLSAPRPCVNSRERAEMEGSRSKWGQQG
eukprot:183386-Rhodomonas_salina.1